MSVSPTLSAPLPKTLARVSKAAGQGSVVFFPDFGGNTFYARPLVAELGSQIDCLALRFAMSMIEELPRLSLEDIGRKFAQDLIDADLPRPLHLAGFSFAGFLAQETGRQMSLLGSGPDRVWIYDLVVYEPLNWRSFFSEPIRHVSALAVYLVRNWRQALLGYVDPDILHAYGLVRLSLASHPESYRFIMKNLYQAVQLHRPQPSPVAMSVVRALHNDTLKHCTPDLGWSQFAQGPLNVECVPGDHLTMLRLPENATAVANVMRRCFGAALQE
jgi:thioesterase domain-containing protein